MTQSSHFEAVEGRLKAIAFDAEDHKGIHSICYTCDGRWLVLGASNGTLRLLGSPQNADVHAFSEVHVDHYGHGDYDMPVTCVVCEKPDAGAPSHVSAFVASSGAGGSFALHAVAPADTNPKYAELFLMTKGVEEDHEILCCAFNSKTAILATAGTDHSIRIYDLSQCLKLHSDSPLLKRPDRPVHVGTLSKARDFEHGGHTAAHTSRIFSMAWVTPNILISAGWQSPCRVWDLQSGTSEWNLDGHVKVFGGSSAAIHVYIPPDADDSGVGTRALAASEDRTIQIFDARSGHLIPDDNRRLAEALHREPLSPPKFCGVRGTTDMVWAVGVDPACVCTFINPHPGQREKFERSYMMIKGENVALTMVAVHPTNPYLAVVASHQGPIVALEHPFP